MFFSERLKFRPFEDQDLDFLKKLYLNDNVMRLIGGKRDISQTEMTLQKFKKHIQEHGYGMYLVERKEDQVKVGYCGCRIYSPEIPAEMGYIIDEPFWGKAYATEAATAVSNDMKKFTHIKELVALINAENHASQKVIEKCDYTRDPLRDGTYHTFFRLFFSKKNI
jgi:ribosomal-protein-alanine N-acetyltransferase